ncbi:hypothetical protein QJQ45_026801 [Haematococcus lacustris]|nr:hypothetical protein QJQ45_026801 [Haematococcus lacustris]
MRALLGSLHHGTCVIGITEHFRESKVWMAGIKPQQDELSQVTNYTASLQRYREYAATTLSTWPAMWAGLSKQRKGPTPGSGCTEANGARWPSSGLRLPRVPKVRCNSAATGRPLALAYGAAGFSGSIGSKGVPVKQMLREACKQFPGRAVLVHEFRTSRLPAPTWWQAMQSPFGERPQVRSMATRSRIRGLMCSTSNVIKRMFYDRDVSAAMNIRRIAAGPSRPRELSSWLGRPAMPNPGRVGQEWVLIRSAAECTSLCSSHASLFALGASCGLWLQLGQLGGDMSSLCPTFGGGSRPRHRRKLLP